VLVEPNEKNIKELNYRLNTTYSRLKDVVKLEQKSFLDVDEAIQPVTTITSFFSLSFFFLTKDLLQKFCDKIASILDEGGVFIGTTIDGDRLNKLLESNNGAFDICKGGYYKKIDDSTVKLVMPNTIIDEEGQIEGFVYFNDMVTILESYGIKLMFTDYFTDPVDMTLSDKEKAINSCYRLFIFKKARCCSDRAIKCITDYCVKMNIPHPTKEDFSLGLDENFYASLLVSMSTTDYNTIDLSIEDKIVLSVLETKLNVFYLNNYMGYRFDKKVITYPQESTPIIDYSRLDVDETSYYSSLMPWQVMAVRNILYELIPPRDNIRILDATANIGVDSINFSLMYPNSRVYSCEIVPKIYLKLVNNTSAYSNIKTIFGDFVSLLQTMERGEFDVIYIDPPWGGRDYKNRVIDNLYLSVDNADPTRKLTAVLTRILYKQITSVVVVKVPNNFILRDTNNKLLKNFKEKQVDKYFKLLFFTREN